MRSRSHVRGGVCTVTPEPTLLAETEQPRGEGFGAVCVKPGRRWERAASPRHTPLCTLLGSNGPPPLPAFRLRPRFPRRRRAAFPPLTDLRAAGAASEELLGGLALVERLGQ
ncbi:unnamed protein product [Rangifer tarandus platyrhynchus]|uniref:Uncharacterized protein n=1 Tax=Rangifer tarandus platyrhynchus TaxID=3082113 RepID=A0AC59Y255_RANTA